MTGRSPQGGEQERQQERPREVRVLRVIDGDTVEVQQRGTIWHSYPKERIRLWGIDAPETSQRGGRESTRYLQRMIGRRKDIWLDRVDTDQYGRTVGIIYPRARSPEDAYNYEMVRGGHAHCYMLSGGEQARYRAAEHQAQEAKQGLWKRRNPEPPWDYRARQNRRKTHTLRLKLTLALLAAAAAILLLLARACDSLAG